MAGETKTYPDRNTPYRFRRDSTTHLESEIYKNCMMRGITSYRQKVGAHGCGPPGAPKDQPKTDCGHWQRTRGLTGHAAPQRDGWKSELNSCSPFSAFWTVWRDIHIGTWTFWFCCTREKRFSLRVYIFVLFFLILRTNESWESEKLGTVSQVWMTIPGTMLQVFRCRCTKPGFF